MEVQPRNEYCNEAVAGQECHNAQYLRRYPHRYPHKYLHNIYTISTQIYRVTEWEESSYYPAHFLHRSIRANILGNCWTRRHTKYLNIQIANKTTRKVEGN